MSYFPIPTGAAIPAEIISFKSASLMLPVYERTDFLDLIACNVSIFSSFFYTKYALILLNALYLVNTPYHPVYLSACEERLKNMKI